MPKRHDYIKKASMKKVKPKKKHLPKPAKTVLKPTKPVTQRPPIPTRRKLFWSLVALELVIGFLIFRVFYIQSVQADFLQAKAYEQQTRDRLITPNRGSIYDRNMVGLAVTETVASVSVIRAQVENPEQVASVLAEKLDLDYNEVLKKVSKRVALERIKTKVDKATADEIRNLNIPGVVVDDDIKRVYPYSSLAAQVIGFVGRDNQGIVGLEAKYDSYLKGEQGKILTETDARGVEVKGGAVTRTDPVPGLSLVTTIDSVVQQYAEQTVKKVVEAKGAKRGLIVLMNPQNGEILAIANNPTFDLNDPFTINSEELMSLWGTFTSEEQMDYLNQMWRNFALNDTYEPGSTFKIITSAAGLEEGVVTPDSTFTCNGGMEVAGRYIKCWRSPRSHGTLNFVEGVQNSCNPVFIKTAERLGAETFYHYMEAFGFKEKTGVDLPGEAVGIMHKLENIGPVELACMSFGQSFQITPLQLLRAASATINGGYLITPHVGKAVVDGEGNIVEEFQYDQGRQVISTETSELMKDILESVVQVGTGNRTYIPGYRIGGKTATSQKLPRGNGKYIASFLAFAPAEDPQVIGIVLVDEPQGAYYGGQVSGPVMKELLENALPYLGIEPKYSEKELGMDGVEKAEVPDLIGMDYKTAKQALMVLKLQMDIIGEGEVVAAQFPMAGEKVNPGTRVIIYMGEAAPEPEPEPEGAPETDSEAEPRSQQPDGGNPSENP